MLTPEQLRAIMPALSAKRSGELLPFLHAAMREFAIETPARAAAFLAQLAHESGQFRFMEEIWGPTAAQQRYEPASTLATTLGNTDPGDGKRFKGRGPIQITGRSNYRRFGDLLGIELVSDPARAAVPDLAFRIAGLFWSKKGLNELADRATADAFREITRRINGGFNGLDDRRKFYAAACTVLGVTETPSTRGAAASRPVGDAADSAFERGHEAIRAHLRRRRVGTRPATTRKKDPRRTKADARGSKTRSPKAKSGTSRGARPAAASPRLSPRARATRQQPAKATPPRTKR
jgi:predicted chitinase